MPYRTPSYLARSLVMLALLGATHPAQAQLATLTVHVRGANPPNGTAEVSLFNSSDTFMREPFLQVSGEFSEDGNQDAVFAAVPTGNYAVVVVHDANGNGQLDRGILGIGGEHYAWSNGVSPWFGWPDFEDVMFPVEADTEIEIRLD